MAIPSACARPSQAGISGPKSGVPVLRCCILNLSILTKPLFARVNEPVASWPVDEMQEAFNLVQEEVKNQINLAHLHYDQTIVVTTDASVLSVRGCVSNRYQDESGEIVNRIGAVASHAFTGRWKVDGRQLNRKPLV